MQPSPLSRLLPPHIIYQRRPRPLIASRHSWYPGQVSKHAGAGVCPEMGDTCKAVCAASRRRGACSLPWGTLCAGGIMEKTPFQDAQGDQSALAGVSGVDNTNHIPSWEALEGSHARAHTSPANHAPLQSNDKQFLGQELFEFLPHLPPQYKNHISTPPFFLCI